MIDLTGDTELNILVVPVVITTLIIGHVIEASIEWLRHHVYLGLPHTGMSRRMRLAIERS
jgi:hypothetical protein